MLRRLSALFALCALAASATAQTPMPSGALHQAVSATATAKIAYAFNLDIASEQRNWRLRFDPRANPRLQSLQPRAENLEGDQRRALERMRERMEGLPWCASEEMRQVANVRLLREDTQTATYSFQPTRESIRSEQAREFARQLRGEFTITKNAPDLTRLRIYATRGFSPMLLVNIERLDIVVTCAAAPNGRRYAAETVSEVRGGAFGQAFNERSVQRTNVIAP